MNKIWTPNLLMSFLFQTCLWVCHLFKMTFSLDKTDTQIHYFFAVLEGHLHFESYMQNARLVAKSYHFMIIVRTHFFLKKSWKVMYTKEEINKILLFWKKIKKLIKMLPTKGGRWSLLHKILLIKQEKILRKTFFSKHFKLSWKRYEKKQIKRNL